MTKNCLHEKNADINCLKKIFAETTPVMRDLGNLKEIVCRVSGRKKFASAELMVEKISCLLEITISPGGNNGLSLNPRPLKVFFIHTLTQGVNLPPNS